MIDQKQDNKQDNNMPPLNEKFERTFCKCNQCKAACKTMPGSLAPGDLEKISDYLGVTAEGGKLKPSFLENFEASEGAIAKRDGQLIRIPTIVPRQLPNGRCVFLSSKDECTISKVAPFGCAQFNVCDGPEKSHEHTAKSHAMHNAIMASVDYICWWAWLKQHRPMAKPLAERRRDFERALEGLADDQEDS